MVFDKILEKFQPDVLIVENYRIYPWKLKQHSFSNVPTLQYIGAIRMAAQVRKIKVVFQMAQLAKQFCTDGKLRAWKLYNNGHKHANDAIRHGCYYLLFARNP
jgi:hypothetical protein